MGRGNTLAIGVGGGECEDREGEGRGEGEWDSGDSVDVCWQDRGVVRVCSPLSVALLLSIMSFVSSFAIYVLLNTRLT